MLLFFLGLFVSCGTSPGQTDINPNFPNLGDTTIQPAVSTETASQGQLIDLAPSDDELVPGSLILSGAIGEISDQELGRILCIIMDPAGGNADLEVCPGDKASEEAVSADQVCPNETGDSFCSSSVEDEAPDFCTVTGARDYVFVLINRSLVEVQASYQVVDVSSRPNQSCADLDLGPLSL